MLKKASESLHSETASEKSARMATEKATGEASQSQQMIEAV